MAQPDWRGFDELVRLFDILPADAELALKEELPKAAAAIVAIQKAAVPIRTGDLWRGLTTEVLDDGLTVRAGLFGSATTNSRTGKTSLGGLFYGRIVEFGRKAQVVRVERRRRVGGRLRTVRRRKVAADIAVTYNLPVAPEPPRPFVDTPETEAAALKTLEVVADIIQSKMQE